MQPCASRPRPGGRSAEAGSAVRRSWQAGPGRVTIRPLLAAGRRCGMLKGARCAGRAGCRGGGQRGCAAAAYARGLRERVLDREGSRLGLRLRLRPRGMGLRLLSSLKGQRQEPSEAASGDA